LALFNPFLALFVGFFGFFFCHVQRAPDAARPVDPRLVVDVIVEPVHVAPKETRRAKGAEQLPKLNRKQTKKVSQGQIEENLPKNERKMSEK
jgi:hypothetical protein